jgi:RNA polymerase sigma factor (sigma-70 family)
VERAEPGIEPDRELGASDFELLRDEDHAGASFGQFYDRHIDAIVAWAYRRTGDAEVAADLAMETFAAAYVMRRRYVAMNATARPWLYGIARRHLNRLAHGRRMSTKYRAKLGMATSAQLDAVDVERIEALVDLAPVLQSVRDAVRGLPAGEAQAVWPRVGLDLPYAEVATRLGCSVGAARVRVFRGLGRLTDSLEVT